MTNSSRRPDMSAAADISGEPRRVRARAESIFAAQRELLDSLQQMQDHWLARAKSEAELATTLAGKLASARSLPDVTDLY